jgi:nicotinate phosphoribosyltransferase
MTKRSASTVPREFRKRLTEGILFTDQYQFAMAQLYFHLGFHELPVQFDHFFRQYPDYGSHKAGFCVNAGLEWLLDWMAGSSFSEEDADTLRLQRSRTGEPLFKDDFLRWMTTNGKFDALTIHAIPEGRVVHKGVPLTVVTGPLALAQILETALLNQLNYQILVATKACRLRLVCGSQLLMEFGARRGQDRGAIAGARAALIGGADYTSNVGISHALGYPPKGTHAHSMVQLFLALGMPELDAFRAFADAYPDDCILLVDTINSLESGIPNAIRVFEELRRRGHKPVGVRLDSGDLAYLSIQTARMLDQAGFPDVKIFLSNELDELSIWQIKTQIAEEARKHGLDADHLIGRLAYGVGTRLITSAGDSALGGVYKLVAVRQGDAWVPAIKLSENLEKIPNPGNKQAWRIYDRREKATADLLTLSDENPCKEAPLLLRHPSANDKRRVLKTEEVSGVEPLLIEALRDGKVVCDLPPIDDLRKRREADVERLDVGVKRLINPHTYHVSVSDRLWELKQELIETVKE